ncbi:hypothetical protein POX_d05948 [Penicillium oxalicum]|uniref:hypothetical protein n=1 Tax=Penicillium oxalicum TaxID=69781 RepID=UPI0020B701AE|nr:hypothetical protein POX_d05948 [Penicillium oxalicum]KAI2790435.1 hypothetical protein POX_d05948 [Penicillium oxalicum]
MSSFIDSILTELGFRSRVLHTAETHDQLEALPNGEITAPSSPNGDAETQGSGKDHRKLKPINGDASILPDRVFFTALPKEMDGRTAELESSQTQPSQNPSVDNETSTLTNILSTEYADNHVTNMRIINGENQNFLQNNTPAPYTTPLRTTSGLNSDESGHLQDATQATVLQPLSPTTYYASLGIQTPSHSQSQYHSSENQGLSGQVLISHSPTTSIPQPEIQFVLSPDDLQPTYAPKLEPESPINDENYVGDEDPDTEDCDEAVLGCQHYHRNVKLQCFTCKKWYTCRFCHDAVESHHLIRRDTENMLCMLCGHAQPAAFGTMTARKASIIVTTVVSVELDRDLARTSSIARHARKTISNMESTFRNLDRTIESQPMPAEFTDTKALIYCNDCGAKSVVKYHWLGLKCDLCESYNTAQIRVLQGDDVPDITEEVGLGSMTPRPRSASVSTPGETATSLAALHLNATPTSQHLSSSLSTVSAQDTRFISYNITHGRAISPVVRNYFGLPTDREPEKPSSMPFFGNAFRAEGETDYGALNFLSKKLRDRYGFLGGESSTAEHAPIIAEDDEDDDDDDGSASSSDSSNSDREDDEEDDEEGDEYIDIFGHR